MDSSDDELPLPEPGLQKRTMASRLDPVKKPYRALDTEQPTSGKEPLKARLKRATTQGSLMGFVDRPLTTSEKSQFERLLANAFLDCFVAVIRTENGTENHIFGKIENVTGVSYTGDYVIEQVESALAIMRTEHNGIIQAVTCDSDGAHRKARTDLKTLHPEIISLPCSAHQINLIFQEVLKFLPKFPAICKCALSIISWFGVSNQSLRRLFKLHEVLYSKSISLPRPTHTRWYSYHFSFLNVQKSSMALQSYAVKFRDNEDYLPGDTKAAIGSSKFWDSLKDVLALLRPLVDAPAKAESVDSNEKAKPKDDVQNVLQTAGPVAEPTLSVDSHVPAIEFDEFMAEIMEKDAEVDADDAEEILLLYCIE
ncbi:hypothetical protein RvY_09660 [Ramazzottius varieornatus]|uniref:DUF659 domain-containing protein n=1 Tax=Ramazzottius varieornatus TaxID=947166 RepID=A0A1D1VA57_RAMVA|nr:hypothetical protein RvY_09660 [Ramazzottius varieornatus]